MLTKPGFMLALLVTVLLHCTTELMAQTLYQPKLVNNKTQQLHDFPMGVLSATGRLSDGERDILVMDIGQEGVADRGGLLKGDRIVAIKVFPYQSVVLARLPKSEPTGRRCRSRGRVFRRHVPGVSDRRVSTV